jgi:hypothetical protein
VAVPGNSESSDTAGNDSYLDDSDSESGPSLAGSDSSDLGRKLPPRVGKRKQKKSTGKRRPKEVLMASRRDPDELTPGTYDKPQYFSEEGLQYIKGLLVRIGILALVVLVGLYIRSQFVQVGLIEERDDLNPVMPKPVPPQDEILAKSFDYVQDAGGYLRPADRPVSTWQRTTGDEQRRWELPPDPAPEADFPQIVEISRHYAVSPADFSWRWIQLTGQNNDEEPVFVDLRAMQGKRLSDRRADVPASLKFAKREVLQLSPDGRYMTQRFQASGAGRPVGTTGVTAYDTQFWVSLHEFDNTLVRVFPDATGAEFVSNERLLLSKPGVFWFFDIAAGSESPPINVSAGGVWVLSPGRWDVVVVEPDEETAKRIAEGDYRDALNAITSSINVRVYDTTEGKQIAGGTFAEKLAKSTVAYARDGRQLAVCSGPTAFIVDMTTGTTLAHGRLAYDDMERSQSVEWLDGGRILHMGRHLVSTADGQSVGMYLKFDDGTRGNDFTPGRLIAGRYVPNAQGVLHEFPARDRRRRA